MHITKITKIYNSEAGTVEPEMYLRGEISGCDVPTEQLDEWLNDPEKYEKIRPCRPSFWTYFYYFCFWPNFDEKYEPENWKLAVNNVNFRKSILHAFDKLSLIEISDPYNAEAHLQNTMTCRDFLNSSGKDYVDLDPIAEFAASDTYNVELANEYKEKAIEELTAAGAHFPVIVYIPYMTGDNTSTLRVQLIEQFLERNLGTDYVDVQVEGYAEDGYVENVLRCGNFSLLANNWYPDYSDPLTMTSMFTVSGADRRNWIFMADGMSEVSDTYVEGSYQAKDGKYYYNVVYDQMVAAANAECVDLEKRYELFAEAENWVVNEQCMVIPFMRGGTGYMGSTLMPFESQYAPFGASDGRYKYQYIYTDGINTEEYYTAYEEWEAERSAKMAELAAEGKVQGVDY
jgi:oligopeptide transport system substrate-binding protein